MARKAQKFQDVSSDDDTPEVVSHSTSKAEAKRYQKALYDFEAEEKARRKARNREKDKKLKERARATRGGKTDEKLRGVRFMDQASAEEDEGEWSGENVDDVEAVMLRAMRDAADEVESDEGEGGDEGVEFRGFTQEVDLDDDIAQDEDDEDVGMLLNPEAPTDDKEMGEDEIASLQANISHKPRRRADYLADDLFATAFASQNSKSPPKKSSEGTQQQTVKKRRRKLAAHPKDLMLGDRIIRTLPRPSDPRSQATARSVPSARARKFVDQSLALNGEQAFARAKKKGWERRPANIGVMKYQGAPHGFARSTR